MKFIKVFEEFKNNILYGYHITTINKLDDIIKHGF